MRVVAKVLVGLIAALHLWFLTLEMFLWKTPLGLKTFHNTPEAASASAVLAMNQGLYNGFMAAGLIWGLVARRHGRAILSFFLMCIVFAGVFGAATAQTSILFVQALPAAIAVAAVRFGLNAD